MKVVRQSKPQTFILAKRNDKVYTNNGRTVRATKRFGVVLDTGAGPSFKRLFEIPEAMRTKIWELEDITFVRNASGKSAAIVETIDVVVYIRTNTPLVNLCVSKKLDTSVILRCDFCDVHVEAIEPRLTIVEMEDVSTVPIICQPSNPSTTVPIAEEQRFTLQENRITSKIKTTKHGRLKTAIQTCVELTTKMWRNVARGSLYAIIHERDLSHRQRHRKRQRRSTILYIGCELWRSCGWSIATKSRRICIDAPWKTCLVSHVPWRYARLNNNWLQRYQAPQTPCQCLWYSHNQ